MSTVDLSWLVWRKSSRSSDAHNSNCVEIAFVDAMSWRKSSRSSDAHNSACVEIAFAGPLVAVRDSKNPTAALAFPATAFTAFLRSA